MAVAVLVASGTAEPYVALSDVPTVVADSPAVTLFGGAAVSVLAVVVFVGVLKKREWNQLGRQANLTASGGGIFGYSDLTGTVGGRSVRARTVTRKKSSGGQGSNSVTYTVVETDLTAPTDQGLMIGRTSPGESVGKADFGDTAVQEQAIDDRFVVVGAGSETLAREVVSGRARDPLLELTSFGKLTIGDPTDTILEAMPDMSGSFIGGKIEDKLEAKLRGSLGTASTVTYEEKGVTLDSAELQRQLRAVVAVADSFEAVADSEKRQA